VIRMSETPLVTIGLPVYNSEKYLRQSLDSLLGQTYSNFILIINDNASTDRTPQICQEYIDSDSRVQYYRNDYNIGNPRNFNRVFDLTKTQYLKWSTADDFWEPEFLDRAVEIMEADPGIILCYPKTFLIDDKGGNPQPYEDKLHLTQEDPADRFLTLISTIGLSHQHLGLMRMAEVRRTHLLHTHVASDINFLAEMTLYGKFYELPERLFYRRFHKTSGSWKRGDKKHDAKYYYASEERNIELKHWRCHAGFFAAVYTSPVSLRSKMRIYRHLIRRLIWDRHDLISELVGYMRSLIERKLNAAFRQ